ncbi:hypothetical protein [Caulobacter sp. 1776]|uniref:hypothetical protein n=1 Tax=Caulobacter sp. 1776 TaxID=3156420 RepID=UPI0033947B96
MGRVNAVYYLGDQPVAAFSGPAEDFEANREPETLPFRLMNGTPWEKVEGYRAAPSLAEFDAWRDANPLPEEPEAPGEPEVQG